MPCKALILDIDGTLIVPGAPCASPAVVKAVKAVQKRGIPVILATGRTSFAATPTILGGIRPDYGVYTNGALILDGAGKVLFEDFFTPQQMYTLVDFCEDYDYSLAFCFNDAYYVYVEYQQMHDIYATLTGHNEYVLDGEDQDRHLKSMPYAAFVSMPLEAVKAYGEKYPGLRFTPYDPTLYDVYKPENTKADGLRRLLGQLGIDPADTIAVGDGLNDLEMLEMAGCGIAMANASDALKAVADRVAPDVREDGLATVLDEIFGGEA